MRLLAVLGIFAVVAGVAVAAPAKEPKKVIKPVVQARAKRISVQLRDLPGFGWKSEPSQADRSSPHCSYYDPDQSKLTENADYTSPDFTRPDGLYVSSSVGIFVSAKQGQAAYGLVVKPDLPRCLGQILATSPSTRRARSSSRTTATGRQRSVSSSWSRAGRRRCQRRSTSWP